MPFIGNQPALSYTSFAKQDFTTSATTSYTLDNPVANANELALFINFVRQEPTTAYSASGTSLTLTSATSATDDMYCVYLGKAVQTVNPPNGSVGTAQLSATGTKDATTFLRGDNTFASAGGTNTPAFEASLSADQTILNNTQTKVQFNTEDLDTDGCYDNSTNYRFTPTTAGKYYVYSFLTIGQGSTLGIAGQIYIKKNGSTIRETQTNVYNNSVLNLTSLQISSIVDMNGSTDYLEIFGLAEVSSGSPRFEASSGFGDCVFGGYKIIE
jgi:hypothetical protein